MSKFNKITKGIKIACLVGTALGGVTATSAYAQESAIDQTEVIEVTGLRASAKQNLNETNALNNTAACRRLSTGKLIVACVLFVTSL